MSSNPSLNEKDESKKKFFQLIYTGDILGDIKKIKQIEDGRILMLYHQLFEIIDIKTKKLICRTLLQLEENENKNRYDNVFDDFIELKKKDLILWSNGKIFYYNKIENNYKLSQVINELSQQKNFSQVTQNGYVALYDLYNIIELDDNTIISCNSIGIKLYNYTNKEYKLIKVIPIVFGVKNLIQIKDNNYLVIHHCTHDSRSCLPDTYHEFVLSLFDFN